MMTSLSEEIKAGSVWAIGWIPRRTTFSGSAGLVADEDPVAHAAATTAARDRTRPGIARRTARALLASVVIQGSPLDRAAGPTITSDTLAGEAASAIGRIRCVMKRPAKIRKRRRTGRIGHGLMNPTEQRRRSGPVIPGTACGIRRRPLELSFPRSPLEGNAAR